jgi:hypothetical protein
MNANANRICAGLLLLASSALLSACGGGDSSSAPSTQGQANAASSASASGATQSGNWSGYAVLGSAAQFSSASGTWTVPAANCPSGASTASATWVGIGGDSAVGTPVSDPTLIQAGSEQDCNGGPSYYAWWEILPLPSTTLDTSTYPVHPGDQMTVTLSSTLVLWTITIHDLTAGWTSTTTTPYTGSGLSAEWIEEAPQQVGAGGAGQGTLTNFGRVGFSALSANGVNPELTSNDSIDMVDSNNNILASPSAPGASGDSFSVCYGAGACN